MNHTNSKGNTNVGQLSYRLDSGNFKHNLGDEFALFAVWQDARGIEQKIRDHLNECFDVVADIEIVWSPEHFHVNSQRFYENIIPAHIPRNEVKGAHVGKIGSPNFRIFIVKDLKANFGLKKLVRDRLNS